MTLRRSVPKQSYDKFRPVFFKGAHKILWARGTAGCILINDGSPIPSPCLERSGARVDHSFWRHRFRALAQIVPRDEHLGRGDDWI